MKDFIMGETEIHYIFHNVKLKEVDNTTHVNSSTEGQQLDNQISWYYTRDNPMVFRKEG